ncbi:hypothetical protein [Thermococcus sp. LS1]|uniref:hypothetical protein n=1 Tax=Thermococcus sp. LS1 TaxID=1638259 RepID=UPI0021077CC9|nr:hypothetical protein [Thermococcus sp. LS1]
MLVIDSISTHFRVEYTGRNALSLRQQHLARHLFDLHRLADMYKVAVLITNDSYRGQPWGGSIMKVASMFRLYIRKKGKQKLKHKGCPCS